MDYLDILRNHGNMMNLPEFSLPNASRLADGRPELVIVLQEPCNLADDFPYETMVYGDEHLIEWSQERIGCPALQEVERHIQEASRDKYDLDAISVFDMNTLLSRDLQDRSKDLDNDIRAAHKIFWDMLQSKAPRVVLVLTTYARKSKHPQVETRLRSWLHKAGTTRDISLQNCSYPRDTLVVRGFHPSVYLREDYVEESGWGPNEIALADDVLGLCFSKAFHAAFKITYDHHARDNILQRWERHLQPVQTQQLVPGLTGADEIASRIKTLGLGTAP